MTHRRLEIPANRLERWVDGFRERHGDVGCSRTDGDVRLDAADGAIAVLAVSEVLGGPAEREVPGLEFGPTQAARALAAAVLAPRVSAVLLVRRGGWAVAVVEPDGVRASKVGTRYVQGRTAAGGWSQQRFARRRDKQTDELVGAAAQAAERVLLPALPVDRLVTGGDRPLVDRVLERPPLRMLAALPRGAHLQVGDPRAATVAELPDLLTRVPVLLDQPDP